MGATFSKSKKDNNIDFRKTVDFIATNYILTQNFTDMKNLSQVKYCNNLVIITSKIIQNNLNDKEIQYLYKRIVNGKEVEEIVKERVIYIDKQLIDDLDVKNSEQKTNMCYSIAKFYILIAHIFAAIITTINPTWKYTDDKGQEEVVELTHKNDIPKGGAITEIHGICMSRIDALLNNSDVNGKDNSTRVIKPSICRLNMDRDGNVKTLDNEPGIVELEALYHDNWDPKKGTFNGMTDKTRKDIYEKDVEKFYKAFTGNSKIPVGENKMPLITKFSDIKLKDFHNSDECKYEDGKFRKQYSGSLKNKLFVQYANNLSTMMHSATENQNKLLEIIDKLFVLSVNPLTNKTETIVNPLLKIDDISGIVVETRKLIVNLYITCEKDFMKGFKIFEAIIEKQMFDTDIKQIENLNEEIETSYSRPVSDGSTEGTTAETEATDDVSEAEARSASEAAEAADDVAEAEARSASEAAEAAETANDVAEAEARSATEAAEAAETANDVAEAEARSASEAAEAAAELPPAPAAVPPERKEENIFGDEKPRTLKQGDIYELP
jgi:methyl-accepting chemotaxis protein